MPVAWSIRSARDIVFDLGTWVLFAPGVACRGAKICEHAREVHANGDYCGEFHTATRLLILLKGTRAKEPAHSARGSKPGYGTELEDFSHGPPPQRARCATAASTPRSTEPTPSKRYIILSGRGDLCSKLSPPFTAWLALLQSRRHWWTARSVLFP